MPKTDSLDCIDVKRRAQRELVKALAGQSPEEQAETLHRLAAKSPLWKSIAKARPKKKATARPARRRSIG